ncbi:MAG TPA: ATP-binding protein [Vicinamibacteria bacterium]|nr:ATP-binding protein [Vicinamibacteria bacterium]
MEPASRAGVRGGPRAGPGAPPGGGDPPRRRPRRRHLRADRPRRGAGGGHAPPRGGSAGRGRPPLPRRAHRHRHPRRGRAQLQRLRARHHPAQGGRRRARAAPPRRRARAHPGGGGQPRQDRLRQIVWNLFSNAVKFTPRGGRVTVKVEREEGGVRIVVDDTGAGISAEFLPHAFERFRQGDSSNTRAHGGLGLGLAVVRHLVELHGGTVEARSGGVDQGATFTVHLPALDPSHLPPAAAAPDVAASETTGSIPAAPDLTGVRVLVVDDGEDVRDVVATVLGQCGADVRAVGTAAEALHALAEFAPRVMVSEIEMHGETGFSLIQKVRALPPDRGGEVPAAALSAYSRTDDRVQALLAGFQIHLPKPVQPAELVAVVASLAARGGVAGAKPA